MTKLSLSFNGSLTSLDCRQNQLTLLNVKNANNTRISSFDATQNPNLHCIMVDDVAFAQANWTHVDAGTSFSLDCGLVVNIPDSVFKNALLASPINSNHDTEIQVTEAEAFRGTLYMAQVKATDLTGIEAFTYLTGLVCFQANVTSLDLRANTHLTDLDCSEGALTQLEVGPAVSSLNCESNQITRLDLSANKNLYLLNCSGNRLHFLNVKNGNNRALSIYSEGNLNLYCMEVDDPEFSRNSLRWTQHVDPWVTFSTDCSTQPQVVNIPDANFKAALVGNPAINTNGDGEIQLSEAEAYTGSINVPGKNISDMTGIEKFTALTGLDCSHNQVDSLNVDRIFQLEILKCSFNKLTALRVNGNSKLTTLFCSDNALTSLNVKNGSIRNIPDSLFDARNNPNLHCIQVDYSLTQYAQTHWGDRVDPGVNFSEDCSAPVVYIPDANFKAALLANSLINWNGDYEIQAWEARTVKTLNVSNKNIADLTGIEAFTALTNLNCSSNQLSSLNVQANTALTVLDCHANKLSSLDVTKNTSLASLLCSQNQLTALNLDYSSQLSILDCTFNKLTSLSIGVNNPKVTTLLCSNNSLSSLIIQNGNNQNISDNAFDARNNPNLHCIEVSDVAYAQANWHHVDAGVTFSTDCTAQPDVVFIPDANFKRVLLSNDSINSNKDGEIQVTEAMKVETLNVPNNNISDLTGIGSFTSLKSLNCSNNNLSTLDLQANTKLVQLRCFGNQLSSLSLISNTSLGLVRCQQNQIASLDVSANHTLSDLDCSSNQLASLNFQNGNNAKVGHFDARGNPNLVCIQVDDVALAQKNWKNKIDNGASFSLSCPMDSSSFAAENSGERIMAYPNPTTGKVQINQQADQIGVYDLQGTPMQAPTTGNEADLSSLKPGVYILKVHKGNSIAVFRVVKK